MNDDGPACPHCRQPHNVQVGTMGRPPGAGDFTLCAGCRLFSIFDLDGGGDLVLRELTVEERQRLARDPRAAALQATLATEPTLRSAMESWGRNGASYG